MTLCIFTGLKKASWIHSWSIPLIYTISMKLGVDKKFRERMDVLKTTNPDMYNKLVIIERSAISKYARYENAQEPIN